MGKSFQERVKALQDFRPNIEFRDGAFVMRIHFNKAWKILLPDDPEKVAYLGDENEPDLHWYASAIDDSDLVFDLIEQTIEVNKEMEKKITLYREKVKELQELFLSDMPYNKLTTLTFTFPSQKKAKKKASKETVASEETDGTSSDNRGLNEKGTEACDTAPTVPSYIDEQISRAISEKS